MSSCCAHEGSDFAERVLHVRHHGHYCHAALGILVGNRLQPPGVQLRQRAFCPQKRDDHQLAVRDFGKRMLLAKMVRQAKVGNFSAHQGPCQH